MNNTVCARVRALLQSGRQPADAAPSEELAAHVASCEACRGALTLCVAALVEPPTRLMSSTCAACQEDLDTYIDYVEAEGVGAALRAYPEVWWHLWTCADCGETYRLIRGLLDAEQVGTLRLMPRHVGSPAIEPPKRRLAEAFRLVPQLILAVIFPPDELYRGGEDGPRLIHKTVVEGHQLEVLVEPLATGAWRAIVETAPPLRGRIELARGASSFWAPFDATGQAALEALPASLLLAPDGPELIARIEMVEV